jgi:hypothetical protein
VVLGMEMEVFVIIYRQKHDQNWRPTMFFKFLILDFVLNDL